MDDDRITTLFAHLNTRLEKIENGLHHAGGEIAGVRSDVRQLTETLTHLDSAIDNAREGPLKEIQKDKSFYRLQYQMLENDVKHDERKPSDIGARLAAVEEKRS